MKPFLLLMTLPFFLISCGPKSQGDKIKEFVKEMNDSKKHDMVVIKAFAGPDGESVVVYDRMASCDLPGCQRSNYRAYNLDGYKKGNGESANKVVVFEDGSGLWYGRNGVLYDTKDSGQKDLEKVGSFIEKRNLDDFSSQLESDYGLSEKRSFEVAKLVSQFKRIKSKRGLTDRDMDRFSNELLGTTYKEAKEAFTTFIQGEGEDFEGLIDRASFKNDIDPEHMKEIMGEFMFN